MYKLGVVVPVYVKTMGHFKYTKKCIESIYSRYDCTLYLVPTVCGQSDLAKLSKIYDNTVIVPIDENCVAKAWNIGIYRAFSDLCRYVLVINSDVVCDRYTIDNLVLFAERTPAVMWSAKMIGGHNFVFQNGIQIVDYRTVWHNYSFFMVDRGLFDIVGRFDENIKPAYGEDLDMQYRIQLACDFYGDESIRHVCTPLSEYEHLGSATISYSENRKKAFDELSQYARIGNRTSYQYICEKWGGERKNMTFTHPFNDISLDFRKV